MVEAEKYYYERDIGDNVGKKEKKRGKGKKIILLVLIALIVILASGFIFGYSYLNNFSKKSQKKENVKLTEVKKDGIVNILILGTDAGTPGDKSASNPQRTDTMMLLHYNPETKKATLVSIPRDTMVQLKGKDEKINAANFYGGVTLAADTVQKLLGININYYVKIDLNGFVKLIDILGGVEMKIDHRMDYDDPAQNLHIHFTKGQTVLLNGEKAMEFFRWRENNDGTGLANGDLDRINIQHTFIEKVMEKVKSPSVITKIPGILSSVPQNVDTNMEAKDILEYGYIFANMDSSNINITTLKGEGKYIGGISYFIWDKDGDSALLSTIRENSDSGDFTDVDRSSLKVQILNGTGNADAASEYADSLKKYGYLDIVTGNTKKTAKSQATVYALNQDDFKAIKSDFALNNIKNVTTEKGSYDIVIILGDDYNK